ncbi:helix-turn-helix transcriptional regulator [Nocardiopsis sp. NPDC101807]|uniref:helix-turn-helix transcriptional regulator n=1 Tax=Nocardiopsis sp. NPDC101807 TaxID=3364339 RepID=UPI00381CDE8B
MDLSKYLTSDEAAERLGISRQVLYNLAYRDPDFPAPTKVGRTSLWDPEDLDAWRQRHPARKKKGRA